MKALVLGCGSIGLRHIGHLRKLGLSEIEAVDPSAPARERALAQHGVRVEEDPDRALQRRPDIVLVCTPAATHLSMALKALESGAHVFVEKPLSTGLEGTEALLERARRDGRVVQVGYQLRFHPAMRQAKRILESGRLGTVLTADAEFGLDLEKWWPGRDYRTSYMAQEEQGGGLLLDVSHEIDLMIWFLGGVREVFAYGGKFSRLRIPGFDVVKILMKMKAGPLVSLHMDCLQPAYTRSWQLIGEGAALYWDCPEGRADQSVGRLRMGDRRVDRLETVPIEGTEESYLEELRRFLNSIETKRPAEVGLDHGMEVLRVTEAVLESIRTGRLVEV